MLFQIIQSHDSVVCKDVRSIYQKRAGEKLACEGTNVLSAVVSRPEHTHWFVVEAESQEALERFCEPFREFVSTRIVPVGNLLD